MVIRDGEKKIAHWREYASVSEFLSVEKHKINKSMTQSAIFYEGGMVAGDDDEWTLGVRNRPAFSKLIHSGWSEGSGRMESAIGKLAVAGTASIKRRPRWGSEGDDLDISRVYGGQLDLAWRSTKRELPAGGRTHVTIKLNIGTRSNVPAADTFWRGAAACILADSIEEAGYRVRVVAISEVKEPINGGVPKGCENKISMSIILKDFNEPLNIETLAVTTAHPAILRIGGFCARMSLPSKISDSFGSSVYTDTVIGRDGYGDDADAPLMIENVWSKQDAIDAMERLSATVGTVNAGE